MESQTEKLIHELRNMVTEVHEKGQDVSSKALLEYLDVKESGEKELYKFNEAEFRASSESSLEMFKSVILTGQSAIKSGILINGGAAVALLAFIGKIWTESQTQITTSLLSTALVYFSVGVLLGALTSGFTYLSQLCYSNESSVSKGKMLHIFTVITGLSTYLFFGLGAWSVYCSFTIHFAP